MMVTDLDEQELQRFFAQLRACDAGLTPPFEPVLRAATGALTREVRPLKLRYAAVAATILVVLLLSSALVRQSVSRERQELDGLCFSRWQSPTDFMLSSAGDPLVTTAPHLGLEKYGVTEASTLE